MLTIARSRAFFGFRFRLQWQTVPLVLPAILSALSMHAAAPSYRISENGRFLVDPDGAPFFWQADTEWELFYALTAQDARDLIRARKAQGFTVIQAMCDGLFPSWIPPGKLPPPAALMPWLNENPTTPNAAFFERMDAIVNAAREEHVLLLIGVYHLDDVTAKRVTLENIGTWTRWLAHHYKDVPNLIWSMYAAPEPASLPMVQAALKGLHEGDGGSHLTTLHPEGAAGSSSFVPGGLSLNTFQSLSSGHLNYEFARADYLRTPAKPVVNGEARYESDGNTTAFDVRRSAWWSYLAGAGFSYGHIENWKSPGSWREWIDAPGAKQVEVAGKILRSLDWSKRVPDQNILVDAGEAAAARSADGDWILVYLPEHAPVTLQLNSLEISKTASASWINPLNGQKEKAGDYPTSARPTLSPPAGWRDALLLIQRSQTAP